MSDILERLRRLEVADGTGDHKVHWLRNPDGPDAAREIERLRLTDDERGAIEWFAEVRKPLTRLTQNHNREKYKDTLRGLLERLT